MADLFDFQKQASGGDGYLLPREWTWDTTDFQFALSTDLERSCTDARDLA